MTSAIIVAAGSSRRMGFNKLLSPLHGVPVIVRTVQAFEDCAAVDEIIVVGGDEVREVLAEQNLPKVKHLIPGGAERHFSVWAGLQCLAASCDLVAVHDGGRPLISAAQITRCLEAAREHGAATCARRVTETLKRCDDTGRIIGSIERANAWVMETPQTFLRELLVRAYEKVLAEGLLVTDEVSAVQVLDAPVRVVENAEPNLKITFPADLALAEKLWQTAP